MSILNHPHKVFNNRQGAEHTCRLMESNEYNIKEDPKGSGRCIIEILDEEDGTVLGYL